MTVRVLQVLGRSAGGIARHVAQITAALDDNEGIEVDIAGPPDLPVHLPKPPIEVTIPDGPLPGHLRALFRLRKVIADGGYTVVHAHGMRAAIDAALAVRGDRPLVLATLHNLVRPEIAGRAKATIYRRAETLAVRLADHIFAVSEDMRSHLAAAAPGAATKIETLYLGIGEAPPVRRTRAQVRSDLGLARSDRLIVTASRLAPQKALDVMIEAVAGLGDGVVLAVLGLGPLASELRTLAEEHPDRPRIRWLGFRDDVADHIAAADVFCLSSTWEGVPLAAQEAVLLGTCVVATRVGGLPELIDDGESGRLVPPNDPEALREALKQALTSARDRTRWERNARADLAERFSTDRMLERLRKAYREASVVA